jgi:hypothetical protein
MGSSALGLAAGTAYAGLLVAWVCVATLTARGVASGSLLAPQMAAPTR